MANQFKHIGNIYSVEGEYVEVVGYFARSLRIEEKEFGDDHMKLTSSIELLGDAYFKQGNYSDSISHYERVLAIFEKKI